MFKIELIPEEVKNICTKFAGITKQLQADLQSGIAIDLAAMFPGGTQLDTNMIYACQLAINGANKLAAIADTPGVEARFQRLGSDLSMLEHNSQKHTISFYIVAFETVFNDLFGK